MGVVRPLQWVVRTCSPNLAQLGTFDLYLFVFILQSSYPYGTSQCAVLLMLHIWGLKMFTDMVRPAPSVDLMCCDDLIVDHHQECNTTVDPYQKCKLALQDYNSIIRLQRSLRKSFILPSLMDFVELDFDSPSH